MPVYTPPSTTQPPKNALIVCAGTVTCNSVEEMGAGFSVFKKQFKNGGSVIEGSPTWQATLQHLINDYHQKRYHMPAYIRIAKQDDYLGGVATVPPFDSQVGLDYRSPPAPALREQVFKIEYKKAVFGAIVDAKILNRPLYIQPLGIGVYGWNPATAAGIFAEAICEADPEDKLNITIPIFDTKPNSKDCQFRDTLLAEMKQRKRKYAEPEPQDKQTIDSPDVQQAPSFQIQAEEAFRQNQAREAQQPSEQEEDFEGYLRRGGARRAAAEKISKPNQDNTSELPAICPKALEEVSKPIPDKTSGDFVVCPKALEEVSKPIPDKTSGTFIVCPRNISPEIQPKPKRSPRYVGMTVFGSFIGVLGLAAVALAFTLLNAASFGLIGLIAAGVGAAAALTGIGLFGAGLHKLSAKSPAPKPKVAPEPKPKDAPELRPALTGA